MFLSGEKIKGERCMSAESSGIKGSSQQSSTSFPKVKEGGLLFSGPGPLITGGLVDDTTPVYRDKGIPPKKGGGSVLLLQNYPHPLSLRGRGSYHFPNPLNT